MPQVSVTDAPVRDLVSRLIDDKREVGVQVTAFHHGRKVIDLAMGSTSDDGGAPVDADTLFSVYSVIKGVTAFCTHLLAERNLLHFDQPIAAYWPEFGVNGKAEITLRDVLTHRAGIPQMPEDVTPELMCDWSWMTSRIASLTPILRPKIDSAYMAMTFGWVVGEVIRRADPAHRGVNQFVQEEIAAPLGITDLYLALPEAARPRYARHSSVLDPSPPEDSLNFKALPPAVRLVPEIFSRPDVLRAEIPAVNGIANARSVAKFFAMIANEGELGGVRLLSRAGIRGLLIPRSAEEEYEPVLMRKWNISTGGFFLASSHKPAPGRSPAMLFCMGMGGALAWADLKENLAVAILHNHMLNARSPETDPILAIANAVRQAIGIET